MITIKFLCRSTIEPQELGELCPLQDIPEEVISYVHYVYSFGRLTGRDATVMSFPFSALRMSHQACWCVAPLVGLAATRYVCSYMQLELLSNAPFSLPPPQQSLEAHGGARFQSICLYLNYSSPSTKVRDPSCPLIAINVSLGASV